MPMYCSPECAASNCKLMGHDWDGGPYISSFEPDKRLSSASITIAPEAIHRYADALHCDEKKLHRAIGQLTTSEGVPGLPSALRGLDITYPAASVADSYYHAKVIECFALLASSIPERVTSADAVNISDREHSLTRSSVPTARRHAPIAKDYESNRNSIKRWPLADPLSQTARLGLGADRQRDGGRHQRDGHDAEVDDVGLQVHQDPRDGERHDHVDGLAGALRDARAAETVPGGE